LHTPHAQYTYLGVRNTHHWLRERQLSPVEVTLQETNIVKDITAHTGAHEHLQNSFGTYMSVLGVDQEFIDLMVSLLAQAGEPEDYLMLIRKFTETPHANSAIEHARLERVRVDTGAVKVPHGWIDPLTELERTYSQSTLANHVQAEQG
jgi:hypothetical protein